MKLFRYYPYTRVFSCWPWVISRGVDDLMVLFVAGEPEIKQMNPQLPYNVYYGVPGILHTPGAVFQGRIIDNQDGASSVNSKLYVFGKLSARCFQHRSLWHRHYFQLWGFRPSTMENRSRRVWYTCTPSCTADVVLLAYYSIDDCGIELKG